MKEFLIEWETNFDDDFPDTYGEVFVKAKTKEEAVKKFKESKILQPIIVEVTEME